MADQERAVATLTPQDLMLKSNPGVFSSGTLRDLTNPREMYSLLSHKTKSTEDLAAKLKQELARSLGSSGTLPKLSRTASMHEIQRNTFNTTRLHRTGGKQYQSTIDVSKQDNSLDLLILSRRKTTIDDFRRVSEENKENSQSFNFPALQKGSFGLNGHENKYGTHGRIELPTLREGQELQKVSQSGHVEQSKGADSLQSKKKLSTSDSRLDKWFADMPNEVFDKAQRAIMEESIKDKLQKYQMNRSKRSNFPNSNVHVTVGSKVKRIPNTYLELQVDTFGKHLQQEDTEEKMNKYRLQQKSMHQLKMRDLEESDRLERLHEDDLTQRFNLHNRSLTTLALTKAKQSAQADKPKKDVINIPTDKGLKTVNMNDRIELNSDHFLKQKHILSNYEEYTERLAMMKAAQEQMYAVHRPTNTPAHSESSKLDMVDGLSESKTKPKIVNLFLQEQMEKRPNRNHPNVEKENVKDTVEESKMEPVDETVQDKQDNNEGDEDVTMPSKHEQIFTKIPTALSNRSGSTSSSVNSSKRKLPLKRFTKLEVFAETNGKHRDRKAATKMFNGFRTRDLNNEDPSTIKAYLKQQQHLPPNVLREDGEIVRSEVRMQDVVFRFEPGEVIVTRGQSNKQSGFNRSSERARIIYGKVLNVKKEISPRRVDVTRDNVSNLSQSTRLDVYRSDLARFENTAMAGSTATCSVRDEEAVYNNALLNQSRITSLDKVTGNAVRPPDVAKKVQTRDVAVETDIIGSQPSTAKDRTSKNDESPRLIRSGSEMSDFIVDNNDGESLDDTDTDVEMIEALRKNGGHSV